MKTNAKFDQRLFRSIRDELEQRLRIAGQREEGRSVQLFSLWVVASWIHEGCTRPISWDRVYHWGESPEHRRQRDGHDWILFSSRACAKATLLSLHTVRNAVRELIRLGLVESYQETRRPRPIKHLVFGDPYELDWYGPNTQIVRVVLEPPRQVKTTPSWVAS